MDFFQRVMIKTSLSLREKPVEGLRFPPSAEQRKKSAVFFEIDFGIRLFSCIDHQAGIIRLICHADPVLEDIAGHLSRLRCGEGQDEPAD